MSLSPKGAAANAHSFHAAVYNCCDAIVMDGMDQLEEVLRRELQLQVSMGADPIKSRQRRKPQAGGKGALDQDLIAEIQKARGRA